MKTQITVRTQVRTLGLVVAILAGRAAAMPANPAAQQFRQPDGSEITLYVRGGEHVSWLEDQDGFTVVRKGDEFRYAKLSANKRLLATEWVVGRDDPQSKGLRRSIRPQAPPNASSVGQGTAEAEAPDPVPARGTVRNLVILCRFSDHPLETHTRPAADFDVLFNTVGGHSSIAPTGSVRDYYTENSYGQLDLVSTVVGWVDLPHTELYYTGGESYLNVREMIRDALNLADPLVDFTQFDVDGDGWIDSIDFIHSGYGAEFDGDTRKMWSHKWQLQTPWTSDEGIRVSPYHTEPALWGSSGTGITRIGVIVHETGHFFGLPDLYDIDGSSSGIGSWGVMANSWGFDGSQLYPPHFSAYSKVFLGWVTPTLLEPGQTYQATATEIEPQIFKATQGFPSGEYLLIENRQPIGSDSAMPGGGLAIWHVDESVQTNQDEGYPGQSGWPANGNHYRVALLQADGSYDLERSRVRGNTGDLYRASGQPRIDATTIPNTDTYQFGSVQRTGVSISDISTSGTNMTFAFDIGESGGVTDDRFEENDSQETATQIEPGSIDDLMSRDEDWFVLHLPSAGVVRTSIRCPDGDLDLYVFDSTGQLAGFAENEGSNESVEIESQAGSIYIVISPYAVANQSYTLTVETPSTGTTDDRFEENDDYTSATPIQEGTLDNLMGLDQDWYVHQFAGPGSVRVSMTGTDGDLDLYLFNEDGEVIDWSETDGSSNEEVEGTVAAGRLYILVNPWAVASRPYQLTLQIEAATPDDRFEENDDPSIASRIDPGLLESLMGFDSDWYLLDMPSTGTVRATLTGIDGDLDLYVFDASGQLAGHSEGTNSEEYVEISSQAGSVYVLVEPYARADEPYSLRTEVDFNAGGPCGAGSLQAIAVGVIGLLGFCGQTKRRIGRGC